MIFRRTLVREFGALALAVFSVLFAITITTQLIRFLGQAAVGAIASDGVLALLVFTALGALPVLLSLTLFISVLMTITRSYGDSEMAVWFSSGLSLLAWIRPVLLFALPLVFTIALLSMLLAPWALEKRAEFRQQLESRDDVSAVAPGVFKESRHSDRVFFIERFDSVENRLENIFIHSMRDGEIATTAAAQGFQETQANGDRYLVLLNGRHYEGAPGSRAYKITNFERYEIRIEDVEAAREAPSTKSMSTIELLQSRTPPALAELSWRVGLPISALILALLAIPLSFVNPRAGRSLNLILALLVFMTYSNFLSVAQAWIAQQKISPWTGLWGVHTVMVVLLLLMFYKRLSIYSVFRLRR
ncbi:MAG: LPS export ABC transporter permease LptF [Burkholderiales bacterium]|nr:LPS export ABC transporter permease LptF [Burkholderiales bacterium]